MPETRPVFDRVRELGLALPGAEESTMYAAPALKLRGKMFACIASHRSAEPGTLVVQVGFAARDELIAADPATYYLKDHYLDYPVVLVRLRRVHRDALRDLLRMAWEFVGTRAASRRKASLAPRRPAAGRTKPMSR